MKRDALFDTPLALDTLFGACYAGRRVLVTGHTGFKGSWLVLWLQAMGATVFGLSLPAPAGPNHHRLLAPRLDAALIDLRDAALVRGALRRFQPEFVFHLGAQALVRRSYREPVATFETNVMGLVNLLEAVRVTPSVRVVINATTDKCYADQRTGRAHVEDDALGGYDPYSASKACAEIVSASYRASFLAAGPDHPIALATARAGNVIGGGDWSEDRLVPDLVRAAVSDRPAAIRNLQATRPWQHVLEPLAGYLLLGQRLRADPGDAAEAWNFGPEAAGHLRVGEVLGQLSAHWPALRWQADPMPQPHETSLLHLDASKAATRLGWRPVWDAPTTFARTAQWYRAQHEHGVLCSADDLQRYVADARCAALAWAA